MELVGLAIEKTEVAYRKSFRCIVVKKDISSHLRSWKFSDPEKEVDLFLSRAGVIADLNPNFVGLPPSGKTRNYAHCGKGPFRTSY